MASEYTIAANAILAVLKGEMNDLGGNLPDIGGWRETVAAKMPAIAGQCAKAAVDALNAVPGSNVVPTIGASPMADPAPTPVLLQQVLGYLQVGCGVIAEAKAIETLISALPYGSLAVGIANMVCEAVMAQKGLKLTPGGATQHVTVKGIRIPVHQSPFLS